MNTGSGGDPAACAARPPGPAAAAGAIHPAFLPPEALELDLSDPQQRDFGDYELRERLGAGGMGVVYRAWQRSLDREVAIKLLSSAPWTQDEAAARFRREARSAARLQHPNIVAIHGFGSHDGIEYYAMALVRGPSLARRLAVDGPMAPRQAARLVRTVAEALHYAHRLGVLHLDLKPGNVLIGENGEPQVADFGLARHVEGGRAVDPDEVSGTPSYMAPEQLDPGPDGIGVATDIYGLGAILYELLTGEPPFHAPTPARTLALLRHGRLRRPRRYRPDLPLDLEAICMRCLARAPAERYPDAHALAEDLGRFLEGREVSVRPLNAVQRLGRWIRREPKLGGAILAAVLALVVGLGTALVQWEWAEAGAAAARGQTWRTRGDAAWRLVVEGRHADALPLLAGNLRERLAHGDAAGVALERMRLGTLRQGGARLVDVVATGGVGRALDLDAAGTRVAVIDMDEDVRLYATADGRLLLPPEEVFPDLLDATFDASGRHAVLRNRQGDARLFAVDGWRARTPARRMSAIGGSWILGDSARFIARCYERRLELLDATSLGPRLMHAFAPAEAPTRWAAQPGGALLALGHADGSVRLLDTASLRMRQVRPAPSAAVEVLAFSRDGRWLLAAAGGHVYVWDAAGGTGGVLPAPRAIAATRLQADAGDGTVAAFAPHDGLLWRLPDAPDADLRERIAAARPAVAQLALGRALPRNAAAYAPGTGLFASIARDGRLHLWRWSGPGMPAGRAPPLAAEELHFDGHHVAVVDGHVARVIAVRDGREAGPPLVHPQPVSYAAFTPDGRVLVTASGRELRAFDWRTGRLLYPPWPLDGTPLQVRLSPDSAHLLATTLQRRDGRHVAIASVFDLRGGRVLAHGVALPGPLPACASAATGGGWCTGRPMRCRCAMPPRCNRSARCCARSRRRRPARCWPSTTPGSPTTATRSPFPSTPWRSRRRTGWWRWMPPAGASCASAGWSRASARGCWTPPAAPACCSTPSIPAACTGPMPGTTCACRSRPPPCRRCMRPVATGAGWPSPPAARCWSATAPAASGPRCCRRRRCRWATTWCSWPSPATAARCWRARRRAAGCGGHCRTRRRTTMRTWPPHPRTTARRASPRPCPRRSGHACVRPIPGRRRSPPPRPRPPPRRCPRHRPRRAWCRWTWARPTPVRWSRCACPPPGSLRCRPDASACSASTSTSAAWCS